MRTIALNLIVTCFAGVVAACDASQSPPAGAFVAEANAPKIGQSWVWRSTNSATGKTTNSTATAVEATYQGKPAFGVKYGSSIEVHDPKTFNWLATMSGTRVTASADPDSQAMNWPLWVGKGWTQSYTLTTVDGTVSRSFYKTVAAFEDVTVAAGTFKAFRIEISPGRNIDPGFHATVWYAPSIGWNVKSIDQTSGKAIATSRTITGELVEAPTP